MASPVERARSAIKRRGVSGVARAAFERAVQQREFIWFALPIGAIKPRALPEPYRLEEVGVDGVEVIGRQETLPVFEAREWMQDHGGRLFVVFDDHDDPAFSCFALSSLPLDPAPDGVARFPQDMLCIERSFTAAHHRGKNLPAPALTQVFDRLSRDGVRIIVTKIESSNRAALIAADKVGLIRVGYMAARGREPGSRMTAVEFDLDGTGIDEQALFDRLAANLRG